MYEFVRPLNTIIMYIQMNIKSWALIMIKSIITMTTLVLKIIKIGDLSANQ